MTDLPVNFDNICDAAAAIAGAIARTPAIAAPALSELTGVDICLKLETLHRTGSFKERGALTKLLTLKTRERGAGVVAMSAGNHAQGVAYHARRLGIPSTIVMPEGTPFIKIDRTEAFGAKVVLRGDSEDPGLPAAAATLAEGIAVKEPGRLTRQIVRALVSEIRLVDEVGLEGAVETLLERQKLVVEGAGAAGLAAVLAAPGRFRDRRVAIVITGGNMDSRLLASILMRGLVREGRLVRLRCELPDVPGALSRLSGVVGKHAGNIVEVHHQRLFHDTSVKRAELDVVVETQNRRHVEVLIAALVAAGFPTQLLLSSAADQHAAK